MSEAEQAINVSKWKDLHAELEEVSDKRNRLQTENNRLKTLIQLTQKECDEAKNELRDMTAQRDHAKAQWEECCEDRSRQVTALREQVNSLTAGLAEMTSHRDTFWNQRDSLSAALREMTAERDAARGDLSQFRMVQSLERVVSQLQAERDGLACQVQELQAELQLARKYLADKLRFEAQLEAARKLADDTQVELSQWQVGHDAVSEQLAQAKEVADMFKDENTALRDTIQQLRAKRVHDDLPGILRAIQLAAEQARELI